MNKKFLTKIVDKNSITKLVDVIKKDDENYIHSLEKKYDCDYKTITKMYGIKKWRYSEDEVLVNSNLIFYEYRYPDKDHLNPHRTLSNDWGYFTVFKSIGWRLEEKLKKIFLKKKLSVSDTFNVKVNGYDIRVKIIKIEGTYNDKTIN